MAETDGERDWPATTRAGEPAPEPVRLEGSAAAPESVGAPDPGSDEREARPMDDTSAPDEPGTPGPELPGGSVLTDEVTLTGASPEGDASADSIAGGSWTAADDVAGASPAEEPAEGPTEAEDSSADVRLEDDTTEGREAPEEMQAPLGAVEERPDDPVGSAAAQRAEPSGDAEQPVEAPMAADIPASPVGKALRELDTLGNRDLAEHPEVYQHIHGQLQAALAAIDDA